QARLAQGRERLRHVHAALGSRMRQIAGDRRSRLDRLELRLQAQHPRQRLPMLQRTLEEQRRRLHNAIMQQLEHRRTTLASSGRALHAVSPLATLDRGYAIVFDAEGGIVRSSARVATGDKLTARLADGSMRLQRIDKP